MSFLWKSPENKKPVNGSIVLISPSARVSSIHTTSELDNRHSFSVLSPQPSLRIPHSSVKSSEISRKSFPGSRSLEKEKKERRGSGSIYYKIDENLQTANEAKDETEPRLITPSAPPMETSSAPATSVGDNGSKLIKFKRTKRLDRIVTQQYLKLIKEVRGSRFKNWTKEQLVELMISQGIELRNESLITLESLRDLTDALYDERPMPKKLKGLTLELLALRSVMARRIQNFWVQYQHRKRLAEEERLSHEYITRLGAVDNEQNSDIGDLEILYNQLEQEVANTIAEQEAKDLKLAVQLGLQYQEVDCEHDIEAAQIDHRNFLSSRSSDRDKSENEGVVIDMTHPHAAEALRNQASIKSNKSLGLRPTSKEQRQINILDVPWSKPDEAKALQHADYNHPRKGGRGGTPFDYMTTTTGRHCCLGGFGEQFDLWGEGHVSEFSIYGSGVTNYFKFIKWCCWVFGILTIVALPPLILNIYGPNDSNSGLKSLSATTVGNLVPGISNSTATLFVHIPACSDFLLYGIDCDIPLSFIKELYAYIDIIISGIVAIAFIWLIHFQKVEDRSLNQNTVNACMYTLILSSIPDNCNEEEIAHHIYKVFGHSSETKVVAVSIAFDNIEEMEECKKRGDLIRSKVRLVHEHRYQCTLINNAGKSANAAEKMIRKARDELKVTMHYLNDQLKEKEKILEKLSAKPAKSIVAFVTFDKISGRNLVFETYHKLNIFQRLCMPQRLRLRGHRISVQPASEPSTIIWENISSPLSDKFFRRTITTIASFVLILCSLVIIVASKVLQDEAIPPSSICPDTFFQLDREEQIQYIHDNSQYVHCYCDQYSTVQQARDRNCQSYVEKNVSAQVLTFFASIVVLIVNLLIEMLMRRFSHFEKYSTEDTRGESIFLRLFVLKYINTCCVFFINNNPTIMSYIFGYNQAGTIVDFSPDWFNNIAVAIILVQLGDIFVAHGDKFWKYYQFYRTKSLVKSNPSQTLTQDELNKVHVGPKFEFAFNYAQLITTTFVCLTFSTGIPVLYMIATANFIFYYATEKYLFTRLYQTPPNFNNRIGERATSLIPIALMIHIAVAVWILSNDSIFGASSTSVAATDAGSQVHLVGSTIYDRISGEYTFPLFVAFCLVVLCFILGHTLKASVLGLDKCLVLFCGCFGGDEGYRIAISSQASGPTNTVVSYTRAVQRNLMKGLTTYNILQNPKYKELFAITWKFASQNQHVRNVRHLKQRAQVAADEYDAARVEQLQRMVLPKAEPIQSQRSSGKSRKMSN